MKKGKIKTTKWDVVDYLKTDEDMADYLEAAMEDGHPGVIATTIGNIARAKGMTQVAHKAGIGRVSLYKALSSKGNPEFATVLKVVKALGLRLHATTL
jgi:probable addiction module antidote protein